MITVWPLCWRGRRAGCCLLRCTWRIWWLSLAVTLINIFTAQTSLDRELDCLVVVFSLTDKRSLDIARNIVKLANQSGQTGQSVFWRTKIMAKCCSHQAWWVRTPPSSWRATRRTSWGRDRSRRRVSPVRWRYYCHEVNIQLQMQKQWLFLVTANMSRYIMNHLLVLAHSHDAHVTLSHDAHVTLSWRTSHFQVTCHTLMSYVTLSCHMSYSHDAYIALLWHMSQSNKANVVLCSQQSHSHVICNTLK